MSWSTLISSYSNEETENQREATLAREASIWIQATWFLNFWDSKNLKNLEIMTEPFLCWILIWILRFQGRSKEREVKYRKSGLGNGFVWVPSANLPRGIRGKWFPEKAWTELASSQLGPSIFLSHFGQVSSLLSLSLPQISELPLEVLFREGEISLALWTELIEC